MINHSKTDIDYLRKKLWCDVWVATASANNSTKSSICTAWADVAVKDFDERFEEDEPEGEA